MATSCYPVTLPNNLILFNWRETVILTFWFLVINEMDATLDTVKALAAETLIAAGNENLSGVCFVCVAVPALWCDSRGGKEMVRIRAAEQQDDSDTALSLHRVFLAFPSSSQCACLCVCVRACGHLATLRRHFRGSAPAPSWTLAICFFPVKAAIVFTASTKQGGECKHFRI